MDRYQLPEKVKEKQARQIKGRFAAYLGTPKKPAAERVIRWSGLILGLMLGAYLMLR